MLTAEPNESDEAYAQRLQAVELGLGLQRYQAVNLTNPDLAVNANTPLMALVRDFSLCLLNPSAAGSPPRIPSFRE